MIQVSRAALPILLVVALAAPAGADHCEMWSDIQSEPEVDTGSALPHRYYLDNDLCQPECAISIWIYEESNGISGMQRDDAASPWLCHGGLRPDTIVHAVYA